MNQRPTLKLNRVKTEPDNKITQEDKKTSLTEEQARKLRNKRTSEAFQLIYDLNIPYPFAIGSGTPLINLLREKSTASYKIAGAAISRFINTITYQKAIIESETRFNLDGSISDVITPEEKERAKNELEKLFNKQKEQKKKKKKAD